MVVRRVLLTVLVVLALGGCTKLGPGSATARTSTVEYAVTGTGQADVRYAATATRLLTMREGASLPFSVTVHTVDHSRTVYAVEAAHTTGTTACSIRVNGVVVNRASAPAGRMVRCSFIK